MVTHGDAESLWAAVTRLRTADYRQVCAMMREAWFWDGLQSEEAFWDFATLFVGRDSRAFLGTYLRALESMHARRPMAFCSQAFVRFTAVCVTAIDCRKVIETVAPMMASPKALAYFLSLLPPVSSNHPLLVNILFHVPTDAARFLFFQELKQHDDDPVLLRRYAVELLRRGDRRSVNLACILQRYFALSGLPGTFSLDIPDYKFSTLDNYTAFLKILLR